jgi:YhcH/YjgK/YiaL family protein
MIADRLDRAACYYALGERMECAFKFLQGADVRALPLGRREVRGSDVYAMVQEYQTKRAEEGKWEGHRRYADIQFLVAGVEKIGFADVATMQPAKPYDPEKDVGFFTGNGQFVEMKPGMFMLLWPHDIHMPGMALEQPTAARKIVLKVLV